MKTKIIVGSSLLYNYINREEFSYLYPELENFKGDSIEDIVKILDGVEASYFKYYTDQDGFISKIKTNVRKFLDIVKFDACVELESLHQYFSHCNAENFTIQLIAGGDVLSVIVCELLQDAIEDYSNCFRIHFNPNRDILFGFEGKQIGSHQTLVDVFEGDDFDLNLSGCPTHVLPFLAVEAQKQNIQSLYCVNGINHWLNTKTM